MENENEQVQSTTTQEDVILPDGWDGEMDFFAWAAGEQAADEPLETLPSTEESGTEESEEAPTTGTDAEGDGESEEAVEAELPTTQEQPEEQPGKIRFDANINHKVESVELDPSELPGLYQKAYAADKYRTKLDAKTKELEQIEVLAKILGYETVTAMVDAAKKSYEDNEIAQLTQEHVHPTVAKDMVSRKVKEIEDGVLKNRKQTKPDTAEKEDAPTKSGERDFKPEVQALLQDYPELKGKTLPQEVVNEAVTKGITLNAAYTKYVQRQTKADLDRLQKENKQLKQNAEAAKRAPVRGVAKGGATGVGAEDPFLAGFHSVK